MKAPALAAPRRRLPTVRISLAFFTSLLVSGAAAQAPDEITLSGVIRDFQAGHNDFDVEPAGGFGHYAGNIGLTLGPDGKPVCVGGGFKVGQEWSDTVDRPIAPHLYNAASGGEATSGPNVVTHARIRTRNTSVIDSYDSSQGPYGGANVGTEALVATNSILADMFVVDNSSTVNGDVFIGPGGDPALVVDDQGGNGITGEIDNLGATIPLPEITVPLGLPTYPGGDLDIPINGTMTIDSSWHVGLFNVRRRATVTINGDVTIVCDDRWLVHRDAQVIVPDGSSLTVYCKTQCRLYGPGSVINPDTSDPSKVTVYMLGSDPWNDQFVANGSGSMACARLFAPDNVLDLDQSAQFFGVFGGNQVELNNQSQLHVDMRSYGAESCLAVNDTPGTSIVNGTGGITSAETFAEWYNDVLGVNLATVHEITLLNDGSGVFEYLDDTFYPIDGRLFGNEGDEHNNLFTYAVSVDFIYEGCGGQFFEFQGSDDAWLFIDGNLVLDVGGVQPGTGQIIELDRLGLQGGELYEAHFFFAHRQSAQAQFNVRTNIEFWSDGPVAVVTAAFD